MDGRISLCAASAVLLASGAATGSRAETLATQHFTKPTNVAGISVFAAPPALFDPVRASPAEREAYGIPPAPDAMGAPTAFQHWVRTVAAIRKREPVVLTPTNMVSGPNDQLMGPTSIHGVASPTVTASAGWSGTSIVAPNGTFLNQEVQASFTVPSVLAAPGSCSGSGGPGSSNQTSYASQWVGIDGNGSNDVLQAGVELVAQCSSSGANASYVAWIEWYPQTLTVVSSPAMYAGNYVQVSVWATSPTTATASIINVTTGVSASYQLTAPAGTKLSGNSVEWIIEQPTVNGAPALFADYTVSSWSGGVAWNYKSAKPTYYYSGMLTPPTGSLMEVISMQNKAGTIISTPTVENDEFLFFQAY